MKNKYKNKNVFLYQIIILLILLLSPLIIIFRLLKKEDINRFIEKFSFPSKKELMVNLFGFMAQVLVKL